MDGVHDMGGMHGFGPVMGSAEDPVFQEEWHGRVFATNLAMLAITGGNIDRWRFLIEAMPPAEYLASSYYERWLASIFALATERGALEAEQVREIQAGKAPPVVKANVEAPPPEITLAMVNAPTGTVRDKSGEASYSEGDQVTAKMLHSSGHCRLPRYVRGRSGTVVTDNGMHHLPDARAEDGSFEMQRLYTVSFQARELWGESAHPRDTLRIDLWESYLEPA
jgi:nitrile hydratase